MKKALRLKIRRLVLTVTLGTPLVLLFQNCAPQGFNSGGLQGQTAMKTEAVFAEVQSLSFGPKVELALDAPQVTDPSLDLNVSNGAMKHISSRGEKSCFLKSDQLQQLQAILADTKVCTPELAPDQMVCMMYAYADTKLLGVSTSGEAMGYLLRAPSCAGGTFLCGYQDQDTKLRNFLTSLAAAGCP